MFFNVGRLTGVVIPLLRRTFQEFFLLFLKKERSLMAPPVSEGINPCFYVLIMVMGVFMEQPSAHSFFQEQPTNHHSHQGNRNWVP